MVFEGREITVLRDERDGLWWFADEVCDALGIADHRQSTRYLDADEKGVFTKHTPGGPQQKATVNESGLYSLILRSRKPEAKRFKRWVTHEVLPQIRRTGRYAPEATTAPPVQALVDALTAPRHLSETDRALIEHAFGVALSRTLGQMSVGMPPEVARAWAEVARRELRRELGK